MEAEKNPEINTPLKRKALKSIRNHIKQLKNELKRWEIALWDLEHPEIPPPTHTGPFIVTPEGRFRPVVLEFAKKYFDRIEKMLLSENNKEHLSDEAKELANLAKNEGVYSKTVIYRDIYTAFGKAYDHLSSPLKKKIRSELKDKKIKPLSNFNQALKKCLDTKPYPKKIKKVPKKTGDNELDILMEIEEKYKDQDEEIQSKGWT